MLLLLGIALAAPPPADPALARLSGSLREAVARQDRGEIDLFRARTRPPLPEEGLSVVLEPASGVDAHTLGARAADAGYRVEAEAAGLVQVFVPWEQLEELGRLPGLRRAREPWRATPKSTITEGYDAVMVQDWHEDGIDGAGATVGVIDIGFSGWEDLGSSEFPTDASANLSYAGDEQDSHGAEVTEILYDFAPGATYLLGAFQSDVQFCEVLTAMVDNDVDVVNASVGFDNLWSTDASSGLTQCVDQAAEEGVAIFVAAGNEHERYRSGALSYTDAGGTIAIDGEPQIWIETDDGAVDVRLRWSETFGLARQDIDLTVYNKDGSVCGSSSDNQGGDDDPFEQVVAGDCSRRVYAELSASGQVAELSGLRAWLYSASGIEAAYQQGEGSISLPGDTLSGVTVGAFSLVDEDVASYSSRGPTEDGRTKPDVVAPAGVSTETLGHLAFEGSSAATPHAAGLAALWVSASGGNREGETLRSWMLDGAQDLGEAGMDNSSGAGLVQGDALPDTFKGHCGCGAARGGWGAALVGLAALLARRR